MLTKILENASQPLTEVRREGDLYKIVTTFGKTFELRYGYYEQRDRESTLCEPAIIYPNFLEEPIHTDGGEPFVTAMQDCCERYSGDIKRTSDTTCAECKYFMQGEEWFGICTHQKNNKKYDIGEKL